MIATPIIATPTIATPPIETPIVAAQTIAEPEVAPLASPVSRASEELPEAAAPISAVETTDALNVSAATTQPTEATHHTPSAAPNSSGKVRAPGAVRATPVATPPPPQAPAQPAEKKRAPAPSAPSRPVVPMTAAPNSSIQLDPELAAEMEAALPYESTLITRNPLLNAQPVADEDATNPGARRPPRK